MFTSSSSFICALFDGEGRSCRRRMMVLFYLLPCLLFHPTDASYQDPAIVAKLKETVRWRSCYKGEGAVCGVSKHCLYAEYQKKLDKEWNLTGTEPSGREKPTLIFNNEFKVRDDCNVGIWMKPLSDSLWLVRMLVLSTCIGCKGNNRQRIDPDKGMVLIHNGTKLFGCKFNDARTEVVAVPENSKEIELYKYDGSWLKKEDCFCSFLIWDANKIASLAKGDTFMEYVLTTGIYDLQPTNGFAEVAVERRCDITKVNQELNTPHEGFIKFPFENLHSDALSCKFKPAKENVKLFAKGPADTTEAVAVDNVRCWHKKSNEESPVKVYMYVIKEVKKGITVDKNVEKDKEFEAFCAIPVATACEDPKYPVTNRPTFTNDSSGKVSLKCELPTDKMLVGKQGEEVQFYYTKPAECKHSLKHRTKAAWFVKQDGADFELKHAECSKDYSCIIHHKYNNNCPSSRGCTKLLITDGIRCPVESSLTVKQISGQIISDIEKLACNDIKGRWAVDGNMTQEVDEGAFVYREKEKQTTEAQSYDVQLQISRGAIVVVVVIMVIFAIQSFMARV